MFSMTLPERDERGFTLIELLVVIIIIGILAAVAIPLFLDQRKLAVDASVKSDVRNTATQVQTWLASNPGAIATDLSDYKSQGGSAAASNGNTLKLSVATDGSYLVCGYATGAGKAYTASSAAYVYDATSGRFGLGSCSGGIVGAGSPGSSTPAAAASVVINTATIPTAYTNGTYDSGVISVTDTNTTASDVFNITGLPAWANYDTATGRITGTPSATGSFPIVVNVQNGSATASKNYTFTVATGANAAITSPAGTSLGSTTIGSTFTSAAITATGTPNPAITVTNLPSWASYDATTGKVSGTPTATGTFGGIVITADNKVGSPATKTVSITVNAQTILSVTDFGSPLPTWTGATYQGGSSRYQLDTAASTWTWSGNYVVGAKYTINFSVRNEGTGGYLQVNTTTPTNGTPVTTGAYNYTNHSVTFTATSTTQTVTFKGMVSGSYGYGLVSSMDLSRVG